jgi:hypothetical protein
MATGFFSVFPQDIALRALFWVGVLARFCLQFWPRHRGAQPTLVGVLSTTLALGRAIGVFAGVAYGVVVVAALLLPETTGRELRGEG